MRFDMVRCGCGELLLCVTIIGGILERVKLFFPVVCAGFAGLLLYLQVVKKLTKPIKLHIFY